MPGAILGRSHGVGIIGIVLGLNALVFESGIEQAGN